MGSLKETPIFCLSVIGSKSTYVMNMGWKIILPLKIYCNYKTWKQIVIVFLIKHCEIDFHIREKSLQYHTYTTLMKNCIMGQSTLHTFIPLQVNVATFKMGALLHGCLH